MSAELTDLLRQWLMVVQAFPVLFFLACLLNWLMGYLYGRRRLRKELMRKLDLMTSKFQNAHLAAKTYREELEDRTEQESRDGQG